MRQFKAGGGRRSATAVDPTLLRDLERLLEDGRRGDPESLLLWTSKSVRHLAGGLRELGHEVHYTTVAKLMRLLGYSLQANVKTREGTSHPDRDGQFEHINTGVKATPKEKAGRGFQERRARVGGPGASPNWCAYTTSKTSSWAKRSAHVENWCRFIPARTG